MKGRPEGRPFQVLASMRREAYRSLYGAADPIVPHPGDKRALLRLLTGDGYLLGVRLAGDVGP